MDALKCLRFDSRQEFDFKFLVSVQFKDVQDGDGWAVRRLWPEEHNSEKQQPFKKQLFFDVAQIK